MWKRRIKHKTCDNFIKNCGIFIIDTEMTLFKIKMCLKNRIIASK